MKIDWLLSREDGARGQTIASEDERFFTVGGKGITKHLSGVSSHFGAALRIARGEYSIVQCRDTFLAASFYAPLSKAFGVPFVYWMSYPMEEGYLEQASRLFSRRRYFAGLARWIIGKAGQLSLFWVALPSAVHVFAQSDRMKADLVESGVSHEKITPVPMGVDTAFYRTKTRPLPAADFYNGRRVILYVGTLDTSRQLNIPFAAVASVLRERDDTIFVVIGKASPEERATVYKQFSGLEDQLFFLEHMPLEAVLGHIERADVCLAPYPTDKKMLASATPTKLVEYVAVGSRVVANNHPDQSAVLAGTKTGILCDFDTNSFFTAIRSALEMGRPSQQEIESARDWVEENRDYSILAAKCERQYLRILEAKTHPTQSL